MMRGLETQDAEVVGTEVYWKAEKRSCLAFYSDFYLHSYIYMFD